MSNSFIEIRNISLHIPGVDREILSNIHYDVFPSDFIILLGSNGSGKSSLLKLLDKRYRASTGSITIGGNNINNIPANHLSSTIKTLTQNSHDSLFSSLTLLENYLLVKQHHEPALLTLREKSERDFLVTYLEKFNPNLSAKLDQSVETLSGGEKQALALALIVLYPPKLLLLDEHTSALDPKTAEQLIQLTNEIIHKNHITCILATHDLKIAEQYGNRIVALKNGEMHLQIEANEKTNLSHQHLLEVCY